MNIITAPQPFIRVKIVHNPLDQRRTLKHLKKQKYNISSTTKGINSSGSVRQLYSQLHLLKFFIFPFHVGTLVFLACIWFLASSEKLRGKCSEKKCWGLNKSEKIVLQASQLHKRKHDVNFSMLHCFQGATFKHFFRRPCLEEFIGFEGFIINTLSFTCI